MVRKRPARRLCFQSTFGFSSCNPSCIHAHYGTLGKYITCGAYQTRYRFKTFLKSIQDTKYSTTLQASASIPSDSSDDLLSSSRHAVSRRSFDVVTEQVRVKIPQQAHSGPISREGNEQRYVSTRQFSGNIFDGLFLVILMVLRIVIVKPSPVALPGPS